MNQKLIIAPSLLSADFARLGEEIRDVTGPDGADWLHVDVMDGHFVPNITIGAPVVKSLRSVTDLLLDVHLMIENPEMYIDDFASAGADIITIHVEACTHLNRTLHAIKSLGKKAGVSLNPATPVSDIREVADIVDLILIMTVNPGFGGQKFIGSSLSKIEETKKLIDQKAPGVIIEVDGGIGVDNADKVAAAGAIALVAGNAIFGQRDRMEAIRRIRNLALQGLHKK